MPETKCNEAKNKLLQEKLLKGSKFQFESIGKGSKRPLRQIMNNLLAWMSLLITYYVDILV